MKGRLDLVDTYQSRPFRLGCTIAMCPVLLVNVFWLLGYVEGVLVAILLSIFGALVIVPTVAILDSRNATRAAKRADSDAKDWSNWLANFDGTNRHYALYLRSFEMDGVIIAPNLEDRHNLRWDLAPELYDLKTILLDTLIERLVGEALPLFCFGERLPGESQGRGGMAAIDSNEWRDTVLRAMDNATIIFVLPGDTDGLRWELEQIAGNRWLPKTLVIFRYVIDVPVSTEAEVDAMVGFNKAIRGMHSEVLGCLNLEVPHEEVGFCLGRYSLSGELAELVPLRGDLSEIRPVIAAMVG